ncbi:unnamed protein product [Polarella glacialis]|nr:unnamed protein product [Polarella glacialis]
MKYHKESIDQMQVDMTKVTSNPSLDHELKEQMVMLERSMQREQAKQVQIDNLMQRLGVVQQQLTLQVSGGWPGGTKEPSKGMPSRAAADPRVPAAVGKKAPKKAAKKAAKPLAAGLRAEAPEFVPVPLPPGGSA